MPTALSGTPRPREPAPGAAIARSAASVTRFAWTAAVLSSAALLWAAAGAARSLLREVAGGSRLALVGMAATFALSVGLSVAFARRRGRESRGLLESAAVGASLFLVLAAAGHLLHPRGAEVRDWVPPELPLPLVANVAALLAGLVVAPLVGGLLVRGTGRALDVAGASPWSVAAAASGHRDGQLGAPGAAARTRAYALAWLAGLRLPGLLAVDLALSAAERVATRRDAARAVIHLDAPLHSLAKALSERAWRIEARDDGFAAAAPEAPKEAPRVRVRTRRLAFPPCAASRALALEGPAESVARLRVVLEHDLAFAGRASWTGGARRIEARLDAFAREAEDAWSHEERGALLQAVDAVEARMRLRPLLDDEWTALSWKALALRARLLQEPPAPLAQERRPLAPAPALAPELSRLLDAGGLDAAARLVYVPHYLVPVRTSAGEVEVAVNALTQRVDARESRDLLAALEARGAGLRAHGARPFFAPAPPPTAALLGDVRAATREGRRVRTTANLDAVDLLYVPFVEREGVWRNAVTGREAPDLAEALARAAPAEVA